MANYNTLKTAIQEVIKTNGNEEITGQILQDSLLAMINSLGSQFQFTGVATPSTNPGTPDHNVAYIAGPGTYSNFNNTVVPDRCIGIFCYNGSWTTNTIQTTPLSVRSGTDGIIQLYDGDTPVFPKTKAEAVFFGNDTSDTLDARIDDINENINQLEQTTNNDFGVALISTQAVTGSIACPLVNGERYYLKFTSSAQLTITITLRSAAGSSGPVVQTITNNKTFDAGTHIIKFDCNVDNAKYLRMGDSWSNLSDVVVYGSFKEQASEELKEIYSDATTELEDFGTKIIFFSNGSVSGDVSHHAYKINNKNSFRKVRVNCSGDMATIAAIAFYNSTTIGSDSYMGEASIAKAAARNIYEADIPSGCECIAFVNANTYTSFKVELLLDSLAIQNELSDIENNVDPVDNLIPTEDVPIDPIRRDFSFIQIIDTWGYIGDSMMSGQQNCYDNQTDAYYNSEFHKWGNMLNRMFGITGTTYAQGGFTTAAWLTNETNGWPAAKQSPKNGYIIALGINDSAASYPVGDYTTDVDLSNYNNNASTFAGYYAGIIQRLKSISPRAKIFVLTLHKNWQAVGENDYRPYSAQIRGVASLFDNVFVVDIENYSPGFSGQWSNRYRLVYHLCAAGYQYISYLVGSYIDWLIRKNFGSFKDAGLLNSNYSSYKCYSISGTVTDGADHVAGALVSLIGDNGKFYAETDQNGNYIIRFIKTGSYTIYANKTGYSTNSENINVDSVITKNIIITHL